MITKRAVLAEAATIELSGAVTAAVARVSAAAIRDLAAEVKADGIEAPGAILHEVAVRIAMRQDVDW